MRCQHSGCTHEATGTLWFAYHENPTNCCLAIPICEGCQESEWEEWNDAFVKPHRPYGYIPNVVTDIDWVISEFLEGIEK